MTRLSIEHLEDRAVPTLLGQQLFPLDNPWNQQISDAPVAANSTAIINNIISSAGDGRIHPDFGQDSRGSGALYGIPFNVVHGNSTAKVNVVIGSYADESDIRPVPIPPNAVLEGDFQNGPRTGLSNRGDSHLIIWDQDNNVAYEFYAASRPSENADGQWHAAQESVWDMKTNTFRTIGWTSADAAGLSVLAGLVRPDEALPVSEGGQGVIKHAIRFTLQNSIILNQFLYPASHIANTGSNIAIQPPMGARFRLKANVDISQLNPESKVIAQAMKDYGLIVADNGSNFFFTGASYSVDANNQFALTFRDSDIQDTAHGLKSLNFSDFEVVDLTPAVTGLSTHQAAPGSTITIMGRDFSGAAGRLQVLFGTTPATSFTIVDDSHITAVVPTGAGSIDVRVQSGITTSSNTRNYTNPIFGYGISANTANDDFTFGPGGGTSSRHFDFGTLLSPLASGFARITEAIKYSAASGYGWQSGTIASRDRGVGTDLTRDFNFTSNGTFAVDLANGTYNVTVTMGDQSYSHDQMGVFLEGVQVDSVTTLAGQFATKTYTVTLSDGQLTLQLKDLGGSDPNVVINGLDIVSAAGSDQTGPRVTASSPSGNVSGSVDHVTFTFSEAILDGSFTLADVDSFTGPSGAITPTAVNKISSTQYEVDFAAQSTPGNYSLVIGPHISDLAGNDMDQNQNGTNGEDPNDRYTAVFTLTNLPQFHFDFGTASSPVLSGDTQVTEVTKYSAALGYGWQSGTIASRDRGVGTDLTRDFNFTTNGTFAVDLANGTYNVTVTMGDRSYSHDQMGVFLEGVQVDSVNSAAGQFVTRTYSVTVSDGQLTLQMKDLGGSDPNIVINGLDIVPA